LLVPLTSRLTITNTTVGGRTTPNPGPTVQLQALYKTRSAAPEGRFRPGVKEE
jgi:hypothetical protein